MPSGLTLAFAAGLGCLVAAFVLAVGSEFQGGHGFVKQPRRNFDETLVVAL